MRRALLLTALIAGWTVTTASAREVRTVSWFVAHPEAVKVVRQMCRDNPGEGGYRNPNCINSEKAEEILVGDPWGLLGGEKPGSKTR